MSKMLAQEIRYLFIYTQQFTVSKLSKKVQMKFDNKLIF